MGQLNRLCLMTILGSAVFYLVSAYDGSETFLHYYAAPEPMKTEYKNVCKSIVLSNTSSDTLKNAKNELDIAIPKLLGGSALPVADGEGAIVLAEQGSAPVSSAGIDYSKLNDEGFIIKSIGGKTYITGKNQVAVLRGTFHFIRLMQTAKSIKNLDIVENPYFPIRVLDHWINHYGSNVETERVYGGGRVFKMENFGRLTDNEKKRIIDYCRMATALGLNGMCPDNVNTYREGSLGNYKCLEESNLATQKVFADMIGTWGLKYYLSVSYASPRIVNPKISTADVYKSEDARRWWKNKVEVVRSNIKNFGGFLMKADSEGEEGPRSTYGESQSEGANPMAQALKQYGHVMIWRTFIYDTSDPDFAVNQSKEFADPPQTWDEAVIIRMKDGPRDFQMIEPPHQLLAMPGARLGMEFQITQEYTGQDKHLCWLVPRWKQVLDWDIKGSPAASWSGAAGTITHQLLRGSGSRTGGVWAISNLSDATNWTGHFLHQANYYGWGRLAWNPTLPAEQIADEWIRCSMDNGHNYGVQAVLKHMLLTSWEAYTDYTIDHSALMPALGNNNHYEIDFDNMRNINFYSDYFMDFSKDCSGIGVSRCNQTAGTVRNNFARKYYPAALADSFCNIDKCPEDYVLFFHHLGWEHKMKGGMTLIQQLQFEHFNGVHRVEKYIKYWDVLNANPATSIDAAIYSHVSSKLKTQLTDATRWANTFRTQFGRCYSKQVPCNLSIVTPNDKAVSAAVGANVTLTASLKTQNGTAVTDGTFKWSVSGGEAASLSATEGTSTVFSATQPGIYTVKLWDSRWPNQFEDELIFVGNWWEPPTGIKGEMYTTGNSFFKLKISQGVQKITITTPVAGKINILSLQGRVVKSFDINNPGTVSWNNPKATRGLYLLQIQNESQILREKFFVR